MSGNDVELLVKAKFREMVIEKGFGRVTVSELCERANICRKTFYAYFDNKHQLLEVVFDEDVAAKTELLYPTLSNAEASVSSHIITDLMYRSLYDNRDFYLAFTSKEDVQALSQTIQKCTSRLHFNLASQYGEGMSEKLRYAMEFGAGASVSVLFAGLAMV